MSEALLFSVEKSIASLSYNAMSASQRVFVLIWELESEVNNGGFLQYFYSSSGKYAPQVPDALTKIGASHCSKIVAEALSLVSIVTENWLNDEHARITSAI